ncbi:MAG: S-layer family protein, partial [Cyanobacteria bacterium J06636_27]
DNGGFISSDNLDFGNGGNAGDIFINARTIDVNGGLSEQQPSKISALSENDFSAGSVNITTEIIRIRNGAKINVSNESSGQAGNLNIKASNFILDNGGTLTAKVNGGQQGNINLYIDKLILLQAGSSITTNATNASQGGNIVINSPVIAGFKNSDIIANAVDGNGGNINITTQGIFGSQFRHKLTDESDITASSQFGINGTVEINNVGIDPSSGLVDLPVELLNPSQEIVRGCSNQSKNKFVVTGRGGIPLNPTQWFNVINIWSKPLDSIKPFQKNYNSTETSQIYNHSKILEATGFIRNQQGKIELVALRNRSLRTTQPINCRGDKDR